MFYISQSAIITCPERNKSIHIFIAYFVKIYFKPYTLVSLKNGPRVTDLNFTHFPYLSHACCMPRNFIPLDVVPLRLFGEEFKV